MNTALQNNTAFQSMRRPTRSLDRVLSSDVFTSHAVRVPQLRSSWNLELGGRLNELAALPIGWDGYAGQPVSFQCANFVASMLERLCRDDVPAPSLVPGNDGSLQVEWHRNMVDVELDILRVNEVIATLVDRRTDEETVLEIQSDFTEIVDWISLLSDQIEMADQEET